MLPVIYSASSTEFSSNGQGVLIDCLSCKVTEERNGIFEMELTYPINGQHADKLVVDAIIKATAHKGDSGQLFRIYAINKNLDGNLDVHCQHISYQLSFIPCAPFTAANIGAALTAIRNGMQTQDDGFTFTTDKTTVANMTIKVPTSTKSVLGGMEGSLLDIYRGEYEFNNFNVQLWNSRGTDRGVVLRYGKNITDIDQESNIADTFTGLRPFYYDEDELVQLDTEDKCIWCENASSFPYKRVLILDCTSEFGDLNDEYGDKRAPTQAELLDYAQRYLANHEFGVPKVTVKVEFEALWDTPEYAEVANLETVNLCDTVHVKFEELGISVDSKIIKTQYDSLLDRYVSLTIGSVTSSFTDSVAQITDKTVEMIDETATRLELAQQRATETLLGLNGGYKVEKRNGNGQIIETMYMDTLDEGTATQIWRWNINGLGYSPNGPEGPYTIAITKNGEIVADFITTGTLDASRVNVTNLYASAIHVSNNQTLDERLEEMQASIDNNIENYSGADVPTLNNYPAEDWTTAAQRTLHIGDIYYVVNPNIPEDGRSYRFVQNGTTFEWSPISDTDAAAALAKVGELEETLENDYYDKTSIDNQFTLNNQGLLSTVSQTYSTKTQAQGYANTAQSNAISAAATDATNKANAAVTSANAATDQKLQNYSTTSQMASAISQSASAIELSVSQTYSTKTEAQTWASNAEAGANSATDLKLENYSTTEEMNSAITQSANSITLSVSQTYSTKNEAQGYANTAQSNAISAAAADATSKANTAQSNAISAAATDATNKANAATTAANNATDQKLQNYSTTTQMNSAITQSANSITTSVSNTYATKATVNSLTTRVSTAESTITQQATQISSKVSQTDYNGATIASLINQSADSVDINASHINLNGVVTANNYFKINSDGSMAATAGTIGGWSITAGGISKSVTLNGVTYDAYIQSNVPNLNAAAFGTKTTQNGTTTWPFWVKYDGSLYATAATITGNITATSGKIANFTINGNLFECITSNTSGAQYRTYVNGTSNINNVAANGAFGVQTRPNSSSGWTNLFYVLANGGLYAASADITGKITASSGSIAGWDITSSQLFKNVVDSNNTLYQAYIQSAPADPNTSVFGVGIRTGSNWAWPFWVKYNGQLYASNATISGHITATSGTIGGCTISGGTLQVANANITYLNGSKITEGTVAEGRIDSKLLRTANLSSSIASLSMVTMGSSTITNYLSVSGALVIPAYISVNNVNGTLTNKYPRWYTMPQSADLATVTAIRNALAGRTFLTGM